MARHPLKSLWSLKLFSNYGCVSNYRISYYSVSYCLNFLNYCRVSGNFCVVGSFVSARSERNGCKCYKSEY